METTQVTPGPGPDELEKVASALIRLADHPHDVVWHSRGGHFTVPEEVAVRYAAEQAGELAAAAEAAGTAEETPAAKPARPSRRRAAAKKPAEPAAEKPAAKPRSRRGKKKEGGES